MINTHSNFQLDPRLKADCELVLDLPVCRVLLMNNASVAWFILVPRIVDATELTALSMENQQQILMEINQVASALEHIFMPHKLNIGALGNVVSQLHIHVIGRFHKDPAWPNPVWGNLAANEYEAAEMAEIMVKMTQQLS